jgi:hypothetical protein
MEAVIILLVIAYLLFHRHHYRRNRRAGFGVWYSLRGPFHTRWTISKRWR